MRLNMRLNMNFRLSKKRRENNIISANVQCLVHPEKHPPKSMVRDSPKLARALNSTLPSPAADRANFKLVQFTLYQS